MDDIARAQARAWRLAAHLPGIEEGTSYGTPAVKVRGKLLTRIRDGGTLVLMCPLADKELLMEAAPDIYHETDHYRGWPAVLVRLAAIADDELALRIEQAWRMKAPKTLVKQFDAGARSP
ncbi:MAG: MmcQ/YjbR family DNA-binding protein [Sphingomonadales bacterium]